VTRFQIPLGSQLVLLEIEFDTIIRYLIELERRLYEVFRVTNDLDAKELGRKRLRNLVGCNRLLLLPTRKILKNRLDVGKKSKKKWNFGVGQGGRTFLLFA
jgi:hypothetical protein